ncbi:TRAP transporter substrate-binding protein [Dethiosulfovibrio sp. F2B]|uniref:TRAP transporter substrate-binding protein n=1 Tax=Dethiosulfovibrio faecalis TaxID=2720018 RepID=UPI001F2BF25B|nr:TRAP transporter substrate-binding protein [Dethiosulfovibrio faecalis]MCF4150349.1 TRAP transporter substrate-binding protein [Dethiosulfovibrio faecalis]
MRRLITALFVCSIVIASTAAFAADYPKMTIRLSHNQPTGSPEDIGAETFKAIVEDRSGGKMEVQIFPSMQMGSMREQTESAQMGTLDITIQPVSVLTPFVEELQIIDFPFLWPSTDELYRVMDGPVGQRFYEFTEPKGLVSLGLWASGFKQFTTKGIDIHVPEDFKGVKMRVMPSPLLIAQYKTWGANPIPIEYAELYNALQQGIVDGQENPIQTIAMNKLYEVQDRLILSNHGFLAYIFVVNKGWFDGLPDDARELVLQAEKEARLAERGAQAKKEAEYLDEIKSSGISVTELTDEEYEAFSKKSRSVHDQFASTDAMKELLSACYDELGKN